MNALSTFNMYRYDVGRGYSENDGDKTCSIQSEQISYGYRKNTGIN